MGQSDLPEDEFAGLNDRLSSLLERTANALKGEPEPGTAHSWHDLPEMATMVREMLSDARSELDMLREALGVSYEPHQNLLERMLEAAQRRA